MKIKNKLEIILKTPNANNDHLEIIESGDFIKLDKNVQTCLYGT